MYSLLTRIRLARFSSGPALVVAVGMLLSLPVQSSEFAAPWEDPLAAIVIDPYQNNKIDWGRLVSDARVVGVIHRATHGLRVDTKYLERREEARKRGYKWGSYHLILPGDPKKQAEFYMQATNPSPDEVIALDIESLDASSGVGLQDVASFIIRVREIAGRYPLVYANHDTASQISRAPELRSLFEHTHLWYARFRLNIPDFPVGIWKTYTLWQFSSEINCKPKSLSLCAYRVPGTDVDMDVNVYNGSVAEAKAKWPFTNK